MLGTGTGSQLIENSSGSSSGSSTRYHGHVEPEFKKAKLTVNFLQHSLENKANMLFGPACYPNTSDQSSSSLSNNNSVYIAHKKLEERIGGILCCTVCLDLPAAAIYQCTNGHLMCAGCFSHLLADARLKDEQATCPNCRCEISKTSCCRNLAVEKTLSELPASCVYCHVMYPRNALETHQRDECLERPTKCMYKRIGCTWEGPYHEIDTHAEQCQHPGKPAKEIIGFLNERDGQAQEEQHAMLQLVNLLSFEKVCFNDLQFKQYKTDEITPKLYFETNRFNAFFHQWVLKARVNDNQKNPNLSLNRFLSFQLILKSKPSNQSTLDVKFCVMKGPFGEVAINPQIQSFEFNQNKTETDYIRLNIKSVDCNKLLASKIINFRFFMFQS